MEQPNVSHDLDAPRAALRVGIGLAALLAGLDKFAGLLADWPGYVAPIVAASLPVSPEAFMRVVGVIEVAVGLAILTRWPREGASVASVWLLLIAGNLVLSGRFLDVAVRDVGLSLAAFALARLVGAQAAAQAVGEHRLEEAA